MIVFTGQTSDGNSLAYEADRPNHNHISYTLIIAGVMDGATVKVQSSVDDVDWIDVPNEYLSVATTLNFEINTIYTRAVIFNSGPSTDVHVAIQSSNGVFLKLSDIVFQEALLAAIAAGTAAIGTLNETTTEENGIEASLQREALEQLDLSRSELTLLNARFEEAFQTSITKGDVT